MSQLNRAQRIVIVVALGALFILPGAWLTRLGSHPAVGWVGYAPLNHSVSYPGPLRGQAPGFSGPLARHPWVRHLIWIVLIAAWAATSIFLLRSPRTPRTPAEPRSD